MNQQIPPADIKTRFLIISDTHGTDFSSKTKPHEYADVAIHCGDLTQHSKLTEYLTTIKALKKLNAPLKLVIAGNHDFTLDIPVFKKLINEAPEPLEPDLVREEFGDYGEARELFEQAKGSGIIFLDEGVHRFTLNSGASLTVYASPYTLGKWWGFQYPPEQGHDFAIGDADVVITRGPPRGIMDLVDGQRKGCSSLFAATARARPRLHCFGRIHEGWGAKLISWRKTVSESPSHMIDTDNGTSVQVQNRVGLEKMGEDVPKTCYRTSHCTSDTNPLEKGARRFSSMLLFSTPIMVLHSCPG
ncbi:metallophosphoesterase domain-containing protein [Aspergillus sclerotialis]|uniref:Metallophosphoesterase domain-containing protein n=1 Tax=Aspergillus sclerotialis TaxID=2070753 RepID=A0A3A2ZSI1_9EURO|nr:metallophosphoesterase domain-containing protein [Aspergillus sclerotialis]